MASYKEDIKAVEAHIEQLNNHRLKLVRSAFNETLFTTGIDSDDWAEYRISTEPCTSPDNLLGRCIYKDDRYCLMCKERRAGTEA